MALACVCGDITVISLIKFDLDLFTCVFFSEHCCILIVSLPSYYISVHFLVFNACIDLYFTNI